MMRAAALALFAGGGLTLAFLSFLNERLVFQPSRGIEFTPEELGVEAESLFLVTEDGVRIHAFLLPGKGETARALLYLHGNGGNASRRLPHAAPLAALGIDVLLLDYRGYGLSEGRPSEAGVYADARAGLAHLVETRGLEESRVVVFGRSLGGAVAVELAQERALAGLVLECTFSSLDDVAWSHAGLLGALISGFPSSERIVRLRAPLLQLHGDRDEIVPIELGRALFEAAPEPKRFVVIEGAGHNDTLFVGGLRYLKTIGDFLDEVAPR